MGLPDHHRPLRPGHRDRPARAGDPLPGGADLRARDGGHDRHRRGHRLRPVHRHPLPAGALRGPRCRGRRHRLAHDVGPLRALRREHGGDLALRALPDRPALHDRPGHGLHRRRAHGAGRRPDPAAGPARASPAAPSTGSTSPACCRAGGRPPPTGFWYRWSRFVQRRAWVTGTLAALVLVLWRSRSSACGWPSPTPATIRPSLTTRQAYDLLAQGFGPGFNGPAGGRRGPCPARRDRRRWTTCTPPSADTPGRGLRGAAAVQRRQDRRRAGRLPHHLAAGGPDRRPWCGRCGTDVIPPVVRGTPVDAQVGGRDGRRASTPPASWATASPGHRRRPGAVVPPPHDRVPLGRAAAQGGDHEPAQRGRRLWRHGGRLPMGLAGRPRSASARPGPSIRGSR